MERLRRLQERVAVHNQEVTEEEAIEFADRLSHELIDDMAARGEAAAPVPRLAEPYPAIGRDRKDNDEGRPVATPRRCLAF